jgi:hypothetical protein
MMKAPAPQGPEPRKVLRTRDLPRRPTCRDCPFCSPSGKCLEPAIKSGRCGDWVWYVLPGNKQWRRLWVKPRDPRTPKQRYWRARLAAASRNSAALTEEQLDACIAAGAKRRSRPRLGQWGWLTAQQWWVGHACARKAETGVHNAERPTEGLQTKGISTPTWELHRHTSVIPPAQHRRNTRRAGKDEGSPPSAVLIRRTGRNDEECRTAAERGGLRQFRMGSVMGPWQYCRGEGQRMGNAGCRTRNGGEDGGRSDGHQRELWRGT